MNIAELNALLERAHATDKTVDEVLPAWKESLRFRRFAPETRHTYEKWVGVWIDRMEMGERQLSSINELDVDKYINAENRVKRSTRMLMLASLGSFFRFLNAKGWMRGDPTKLVRLDLSLLSHRQKEVHKAPAFTDDEVQKLLDYTAPDGDRPDVFWHAAIAIGRYTGLRISDICTLEWDCLSKPGKIAVWTQKRDKRVELPLKPKALADAIKSIPMINDKYLFPERREMYMGADVRQRSRIQQEFKDLTRPLGIIDKTFHGFRATYVTAQNAAGIPILHIAQQVGHSSAGTTMGYLRNE